MKKLLTPAHMLDCERAYFRASGVPSIDAMERAAQALADTISADLPTGSRVLFVCGTGGNGGDGTACARILCDRYTCAIVQPRPPKAPDAIENLRRARAYDIPVFEAMPDGPFDAVVDALFGTGLCRAPESPEADLIREINRLHDFGTRVYAADIPSGLNGMTGKAYPDCVYADRTVTFQYMKTGLTLADGFDVCGKVTAADIGFPDEAFPADALLTEPADIGLLPKRPRNLHKNVCGHLLIAAGSCGMAGAAVLCASAALRSGVGLVTVACPRSIVPILQTRVPQAMCVPLEENDGAVSDSALPAFTAALDGKDAVVIGCGLTRRASPAILRAVLERGIPAVIDADGLNLLAARPELLPLLRRQHILTPHPGEAKRLISDLDTSDPIAAAKRLAELGGTVLLKGAATVTTDGSDVYIRATGSCGMARGGSGDTLSGIMGALLAGKTGLSPTLLAAIASEIHGCAGMLAEKRYGKIAMNAADPAELLPEVFLTYAE